MDPVTLIVSALVVGAALGLQDTVSTAVRDAYTGLKALVNKRLGARPGIDLVEKRQAEEPTAWQDQMADDLGAAAAGEDEELLAAALRMLRLAEQAEASPSPKPNVSVTGSQGVQFGHGNVQHNTFPPPCSR